MKYLTYGYLVLLGGLVATIGLITGQVMIAGVLGFCLLLWWIAGFFMEMDGYVG
jgi:type IV secretory pathway TrbD component